MDEADPPQTRCCRWYRRPPCPRSRRNPRRLPADDLVQAARDRLRANAAAVAAVPLPMATEPAFQFKA